MDKLLQSRRAFIKALALMLSALGYRGVALGADTPKLSFYVAGARFHPVRHELVIGDPVTIVEGEFRGERCFAIYSRHGEKIGYVPHVRISAVQELGVTKGRVLSAKMYAVPWERYRVGLG